MLFLSLATEMKAFINDFNEYYTKKVKIPSVLSCRNGYNNCLSIWTFQSS